jgi:uncharacterized protein (TIGR02611 family)
VSQFAAVLRFIRRSGKRIAVTVAGFGLLTIGLVGLALPVLPGWLLIFAGLGLLATQYAWAERALTMAREKARRAADTVRRKRSRPEGS